jgi:hypothetical protein
LISDVRDRPGDRGAHGARAAAAVLAIVAVAFGGCGGGGGEGSGTSSGNTSASAPTSTSSEPTITAQQSTTSTSGGSTTGQVGEAQTTVRQAVDAVLVSADPKKACGNKYVTQHYLEAAYGGEQGCAQAQRPGSAADNLGSYQATANGSRATVTARPSGGLYNGEKITVSLVKEDGNWKVDELKSNAPVGP